MSIFGGMLRNKPMFRVVTRLASAPRACAARMALAGLIAGSILLTPDVSEAATQNAKQGESAAAPPSSNGPKKVSPYAILNRRRLEAAEKERTKKGAPAQSRLHPVSVRKH
jgi:hypothetical protein